jgi:hypothetical protein
MCDRDLANPQRLALKRRRARCRRARHIH